MAKKSGGASLRRIFDATNAPVFVVDGKRRIVYCNPAFTSWCGYSLDDLADRRADYHSDAEKGSAVDQFATALCPPPSLFDASSSNATGELATLIARHANGQALERPVRFLALGAGDSVAGVLGLLQEPSEAASAVNEPAKLHAQVARIRSRMAEDFRMDRLLGVSPAIEQTRKRIALAASSRVSVLVSGPPGSGREHVARTIYYHGEHLESGMLVPLSCELLDAELLNTTVDALLNSQDEQSAAASALLLLDVDRLTVDCQETLLMWLTTASPVRTIASSRAPLPSLVSQDLFRQDLAAALSTLVIEMPPLSERVEDIPILAQAFLEEANLLGGSQKGGFTEEAMNLLLQHEFANNADDLRRLVQQAVIASQTTLIDDADLPSEVHWALDQQAHPRRQLEEIQLDAFLGEIEQELIARAMAAAKGNRAQAAKILGVSRAKLLRRLGEGGGGS